jgi:hypothetical protein
MVETIFDKTTGIYADMTDYVIRLCTAIEGDK